MRGPHDVGGLDEGPVDQAPHEMTFWEWQIDGLRSAVGAKGLLSSHENRYAMETLGHDAYKVLNYYERWTAALSRHVVAKGILSQDEVDKKVAEIRERLAATGELEMSPEEETKKL